MIPNAISARFCDNANYALSWAYVPQIHLLMEFDGRLDSDRLKRALHLTLHAEPVLGCRFVPRWINPYWARIAMDELDNSTFFRELTGDELTLKNALEGFLVEPVNELRGPQVKALLLRGESGDRLVLKLNHQVVDAGGTKEFGYLLASLYRELGNNSDIRPSPNLGTRSMRQVYGRFSKRRLLSILLAYFKEFLDSSIPYRSMTYPVRSDATGRRTFVMKRLSGERVRPIKTYCAEMDATMNDVMVAAMLRAYVRKTGWSGNGALRMVGTVDLRRYLPNQRAQALCNLSSFYFIDLGRNLGALFDDTLSRVKGQIDGLKTDNLGLGFALGTHLLGLPYPFGLKILLFREYFSKLASTGNIPPSMTNLGTIDDTALDFGSPDITAAEVLVPPCNPPFLVTGLSGYRDTLTLSLGFCESALPIAEVIELFEVVDQELPS
ncbi:MAG TPA: hypothetical protein VMW89_15065 [Desulfatiglandales bacterium]|nr:hypothetical protein [Desulfatiglandales bacterium]